MERGLEDGEHSSNEKTVTKPGFFSRSNLLGPVKKDHGDLVLLSYSLCTGMVDAASFSNWGVFVAMQTGNTVILGLSTTTLPNNPYAWLTTLISLISFLFGAFLTFRVTFALAPKGIASNRLYLFATALTQAILIILAAALVTAPGDLIPHNPPGRTGDSDTVLSHARIVALLPPLAFQSGMQIATSRLLGFNELPVNVLTSTYCDLMGDPLLFQVHGNKKRDRRALAVVLLLGGAIASGWLMRSSGGLESVLWIAGGIKFVTAVVAFVGMGTAETKA